MGEADGLHESGEDQEEVKKLDQPSAVKQEPPDRIPVTAIGASAGGLSALQGFFDALPADTGMAFVVVTHMDPQRESLLPELLQKHTDMPVHQVHDMVAIEADHVYVIAPDRRIVITDTHLDTEPFEEPRGFRKPIDVFFRSLARVHRDAEQPPVAIILSGGGTDGAVGVKAVKEEGGLLLVQDPAEAEHDSMPRAAINTGLADVVLPVAELARRLVAYRRDETRLLGDPQALSETERETLYRLLTQVELQTGHDFSTYKRSTILRRIRRRMQLNGHRTLDAYLGLLRHDVNEAQALFNDLLIGVTNFFRDKEAWEALAEQVIPKLFEGKGAGATVRVWSIGCSTGEEAYTLAILLLEYLDTLGQPSSTLPRLQLFASDLDDEALNKARERSYPEAIEADVSPQRLQRFFVKEGHHYRVRRELRDVVIFSNHSVLRDPPFSRLDLISCRNLLIYLDRELQQNVFEIFHYGLNPGAYLFLGSSESAEMAHLLFRTLDREHRIYQARPFIGEQRQVPSLPLALTRKGGDREQIAAQEPRRVTEQTLASSAILHLELLEEIAPPSVLVDDQHRALHLSGNAGRYLLHPGGVLTNDLLKLVRPELQFELRAALHQALEQGRTVVTNPVLVQFNGVPHPVTLVVRPRPTAVDEETEDDERLALVFFVEDEATELPVAPEELEPIAKGAPESSQRDALLAQMGAEAHRLREQLQATVEEYESSNEALKVANEELQSINEEDRSTTEELETSKEELQSVNEELQTVNNELKNKLAEISRAHSDLENLMAATEIATLFLDQQLCIRRYTPGTTELFNVMPGDLDRSIGHLTNKLDYDELADDATQVLKSLVPVEREVRAHIDGQERWLLARLRPYRTVDDRIEGVVLTFIDVTELKAAQEELRREKEYSEKIVDTVREGLLVLRPDLTVEFANEYFLEMFQVDRRQTLDSLIYDLGNGQWDIPELRTLLEEILQQENIFNDYRVEHKFQTVGRRVMLFNARRLDHEELILLAIEDITEREQYAAGLRQRERELAALNETLEEKVARRTAEVEALAGQLTMAEHEERARIAQILHDDLQQQLYSLQIQLGFVSDLVRAEEGKQEIAQMEEVLQETIKTTRQLSVDLSPPILAGEGLAEAIGWLANQMAEQYGLRVELQAAGSFPLPQRERRVLILQIVRELLFNVVKHAGVDEVTVQLQEVGDGPQGTLFRIDVVDRGVGFDPAQVLAADATPDGRGLLHARERLRFIGGTITAESARDAGTRITIIAPVGEQPPVAAVEE